LHGEDGISFFFDEGYTYIPWNGLAFLLDAMIEDGDYPNPVVEEQPDPSGIITSLMKLMKWAVLTGK
jgi:hypothetical protein